MAGQIRGGRDAAPARTLQLRDAQRTFPARDQNSGVIDRQYPAGRRRPPAFDARAQTLPLSEFEPMLRRLFAQPRNTIYKAAVAPDALAA